MGFIIDFFSQVIGHLLFGKLLDGLKPLFKGKEIHFVRWLFILVGVVFILVSLVLLVLSIVNGGKVGELWICIGAFLLVGAVSLIVGAAQKKNS